MASAAEDEERRMQALSEQFPNAEHGELLRFCRARPRSVEDAVRMYDEHLQWRAGQGSATNLASAAAATSPKFLRRGGVALDGSPLFYLVGGAYNPEVGPEQHTLALAHLIDSSIKRCDEGQSTVLVDTRPKTGLYNVPAPQMVSFFQMTASVLQKNYPERLRKLIIYPLPGWAVTLWWVVKRFLDPRTASKCEILSGAAVFDSPCPEALGEFVSLEQLPRDTWEEHKELLTLADGQQPLHGAQDASTPEQPTTATTTPEKPAVVATTPEQSPEFAEADDGGKPEDNVELLNKE